MFETAKFFTKNTSDNSFLSYANIFYIFDL